MRRGHAFDEVASALQKAIRRGQEEDAIAWALELDASGYTAYVWRRLLVITSEDVGLAEPHMPATIHALHQNALTLEAKRKGSGRLQLVHATLLLARGKKSRIVDHALIALSADETVRPIPGAAIDKHTKRGRAMGRGQEHFFEEGSLLANVETGQLEHEPHLPDPYRERAMAARQPRRDPEPNQMTIEEEAT
jgi:replication-associated recombination protein RarA